MTKDIEAKYAKLEHEYQQYAYAVSHDFSAPIRQIGGFLQLIEKALNEHIDEKTQRHFDFIYKATHSAQEMLEGLLAYSRIESQAEEPIVTELNDSLAEALGALQSEIESKNAIVEADSLPSLMAEPKHIRMLFQLLIHNALTFQPEGQKPQIRLSNKSENGCVVITIEDNGLGLTEDDSSGDFITYEKLFTPLRKGKKGSLSDGPGMGLPIAKRIVERMGGSIEIAPKSSEGTRVTLSIPETT